MEITKQFLKKFIIICIGLFGLSTSIIIHEFGHFLACKFFNVPTPIFSIGFGPVLVSYTIGTTIFQIAALPLGGYVAINDVFFATIPYWQQLIIMLAGIVFNVLFALAIFIYLTSRAVYRTVPTIASVTPHSPASQVDLQPGDIILAFDNSPIHNDATHFVQTILRSANKTIICSIARNGTPFTVPIHIANNHPTLGEGIGWLGVEFEKKLVQKASLIHALSEGPKAMKKTIARFGTSVSVLFYKNGGGGVTGPVGIIAIVGRSISLGFYAFLFLLAIININLAFFNLLPIPIFDGGQIVFYTIRALYGPLPSGMFEFINIITVAILLLLTFAITMRDISNLRQRR